jgi:hypothetical protein
MIHPDVRNDEQLNKHIIPSSHTHLTAVPNFSLEAKGPDGSPAEALRQACHNGAVGERAMHSLKMYGQDKSVYDNTAHRIYSIYQGAHSRCMATSAILSTLDQDEDLDDSETSVEEEVHKRPPSKRPMSKSHRSHRRPKRKTGTSNSRRSNIDVE